MATALVTGANRGIDGVRVDLLINNAGILTRESLDDMDFDRIRRQFEVNALGPAGQFNDAADLAPADSTENYPVPMKDMGVSPTLGQSTDGPISAPAGCPATNREHTTAYFSTMARVNPRLL